MKAKILGIIDAAGDAAIYETGNYMGLYVKDLGNWQLVEKIPIEYAHEMPLNQVRRLLEEWALHFKSAKNLVAGKMIGLPYQTFDRQGYNIWEVEGPVLSLLDQILEESEATAPIPISFEDYLPKKLEEDGCFTVDLRVVQSQETGITSKQILIPFLESTPFFQLELWCSHIPGWLMLLLESHQYHFEKVSETPNEICLLIKPKTCETSSAC